MHTSLLIITNNILSLKPYMYISSIFKINYNSMSVTGISSNPDKTMHWKNDSGELDVFEAARYFSTAAANDQSHPPGKINGSSLSQKFIGEDMMHNTARKISAARMSLDMPARNPNILAHHDYHHMDQKMMRENKKVKCKQPSSPGGRLASFLNSLFSQTHLKKKKKSKSNSSKDTFDVDQDHQSPGGRRKRRSSISHFRITTSNHNTINISSTVNSVANDDDNQSKLSLYSSKSASGFRTPPPYTDTPIKSIKEFKNLYDNSKNYRQEVISLPKNNHEVMKRGTDDGFRFRNGDFGGYSNINSAENGGDYCKVPEEKDQFRKLIMDDVDDGADSDSSSDLFDLPNHELDFYSSGLPVYETTHIDRIRIGAQISSAT